MALIDEARALTAGHPPTCRMVPVIEALGDEVTEALDDRTIQHTALSRALKARGFSVSESTVSRHRLGKCACVPS